MKLFSVIVTSLVFFALSVGATPTVQQNSYFMNLNVVKYILCVDSDGKHSAGTGFVVSKNRVMTANHVIENSESCVIDHKPVKLISSDVDLDVAVVKVDLGDDAPVAKISCEGYTMGETYFSFGYSQGIDPAITKLEFTGDFMDFENKPHFAILRGLMFAGMSGGPIVDMYGKIVGMNTLSNEKGFAGSRQLSETSICSGLAEKAAPMYPKKVEILKLKPQALFESISG